jgi:hypothetical protein
MRTLAQAIAEVAKRRAPRSRLGGASAVLAMQFIVAIGNDGREACGSRKCAEGARIHVMGGRGRARPHYEDARFGALVSALEMVAADPDEQEPALPALRSVAEAIRRGEPVSTLGQEIAEGMDLPPLVAEHIDGIDERFDRLVASRDLELWRSHALFDDPLFREMRCLAREALEELGLPRRAPTR